MSCKSQATAIPGAPPKADWKKAADGIGLCVFAVFLLLNTTGALPWSFWMDAISLWPLLIMSAGIQITFEKTRAPWLVLLGPAIVLAGMVWVASGARPDRPTGAWKSEGPLPRPEGAERVKLDLDLMGSRLSVEARKIENGALADARSIERRDSTRLEVDRQDDTARLRIDTTRGGGVTILPGRRQRFDLGVPSDLPLRIALRGAMNGAEFDLAHGRFEGGTIDGAFLATRFRLPAVTETVKIVQKGAFNALRLSVPQGTPVTVSGPGFPLNFVKRHVAGDPGRAGYEVKLEGAFTAVHIDTRPALESDTPALPNVAPSLPPEAPVPPTPAAKRPKPEAEPQKSASPSPVRG